MFWIIQFLSYGQIYTDDMDGNSNDSYWKVLSWAVLFITLYKVVLTLKSVDKTLVCDLYSNESFFIM